ncbi:transposase [Pedobacter sp. AK017]|uniref:IS110 family transposase n=1 Tax=Pedobacter sp. AK017 TaxID=2723073 RepID=UPI0016209337|nr:transposase [Pedobacter sp. AK017]MBB5439505.1 transposase [Pedobacter sp. AK017]
METTKEKKYTWFVGIDVSRNKLDYAVMRGKQLLFHNEIENNTPFIKQFVLELKALKGFTMSKTIFCMENTGFYCNHLLEVLHKMKANIVQEPPAQIMKTMGLVRGKNDKVDAIRIAHYAYKNRETLRLWHPRRPVLNELAKLSALRTRLMNYLGGITISLKEESTFIKKKISNQSMQLCNNSIAALKVDLKAVDDLMLKLINEDEELSRLRDIIVSVDHVGPVTATQILICTNEFRDISNPKKFACYAGVAPFPRESGVAISRRRVSHIANKKMKALLHTCAVGTIRGNNDLTAYYLRKTEVEKKPKMSVLNALRYKIILRIFTCVKQNRKYEKTYVNNWMKPAEEEGNDI